MSLSEGYHKYINSSEWYRKREGWLRMANYECEWCSKSQTALHVHHLNYDNFYHEKDEDVIVLCKACHKHADEIRKLIRGRENEPGIRSILDKRGYPFEMKLNSRTHVIRLKRKLKRVIDNLDKLENMKKDENFLSKVKNVLKIGDK